MKELKYVFNDLAHNKYDVLSDSIEDVYFYNDNGVILSRRLKNADFNKIDGVKISSIYGDRLEEIYFNSSIRKANKLNLTKKDNFYIKHTLKDYEKLCYFGGAYDLYIYCGTDTDVIIKELGEYIAMEYDGKTEYKKAFEITFKNCVLYELAYERIICNNYTLKEGETWGDHYGTKDAPVVRAFDYSGLVSPITKTKGEKGILKKWIEHNRYVNKSVIICEDGYSKIEKSAECIKREQTSHDIKEIIGTWISDDKIEKLRQYFQNC